MSCALCQARKEKRFCPALHERICAPCCGAAREVTLDCPADCQYLVQARRHERPRALEELKDVELFRQVRVRDRIVHEREPLFAGLMFALARSARADRALRDSDLIAALTAYARSLQTLVSTGLHYEDRPTAVPQQALIAELQKMVDEYRAVEQKHLGMATLRDSELLEALVFLVRMAHARTSGRPRSHAFIEWLFAQFPDEQRSIVSPAQAGSGLIVP